MEITVDTADGPMGVVVAEPEGAARGGIVVVQEAFGLTDHIGRVCERLADADWLAVAPALFHRTGSPVLAYDDIAPVIPHMTALTPESLESDLTAAFDVLAERGIEPARRGIVGFCMGGTVALWAGTTFELGAAVSYYGGGVVEGRFGLPSLVDAAPSLRCAWLGHYGDLDQGIPAEQVEALRSAAAEAPMPTELYRYAEAEHGFNCDDRPSFDAESAAEAWGRTLGWFDRFLDGP